jgi:hypothetical protein
MSESLVPGHPTRVSELVVQDEERLARARFHHYQFGARDVEFFLGGFDHIILP